MRRSGSSTTYSPGVASNSARKSGSVRFTIDPTRQSRQLARSVIHMLDPASLLARRLRAQLLSGPPARSPVAVAQRLLAIQAQDPRGARLAIRARSSGLAASDVDRALGERSLLITWLNRGTL